MVKESARKRLGVIYRQKKEHLLGGVVRSAEQLKKEEFDETNCKRQEFKRCVIRPWKDC